MNTIFKKLFEKQEDFLDQVAFKVYGKNEDDCAEALSGRSNDSESAVSSNRYFTTGSVLSLK